MWDIGGQKTIRSYWRNYFEQTDGVIWVVDSSDKMRLEDTKVELHNLLKQERLMGATLLIFCNKQDIEGSLTTNEIKEYLDLETISTRHWGIIGCSARTGDGLLEGVDWIVKDIAGRLFTYMWLMAFCRLFCIICYLYAATFNHNKKIKLTEC